MTDLAEALARSVRTATELHGDPTPEAVEDVFATRGDTYQRFNSAWRDSQARESKEGSP